MNCSFFRGGIIISFTLAVIAVVIRAVWQIVVIPTAGTVVIFIPLILTLLGADALVIYLVVKPSLNKLRNLLVVIGITLVLTAGLVAGVSHFVHFIPSPEADPLLSKIIGFLVLSSSLIAYILILWLLWSLWKHGKPNHEK